MSAFFIANQTVTDLLPQRKAAPLPPEPDGPAFDRRLKDADSRFDKAHPPVKTEDTRRTLPDHKAEQRPSTSADNDTELRDSDRTRQADASDAQPTDPTDIQQNPSTDGPETSDQPDGDQQTPTDSSAVVAVNQAVSEVLVPDGLTTRSQATVTVQPDADPSTQATVTQSAQSPATTSNAAASSDDPAKALVSVDTTTRQDKPAQPAPSQSTDSSQPSATAQRIAVVAEARDGDARKAGSDDTTRQPQTSLNPDTQPRQNTASQSTAQVSFNPAATPGDPAAVSVQPVITSEGAGASTAPAQQAAPGAQTDSVDNTQLNTARIARGLQNAVQQKGGSVTLRLTPPQMGTVRIQLQMHNGTVNAQFHAETESTRALLNQQISHLRSALEQQGLTVERLGVQLMQPTSGSSLQNESQDDRDGQANDGRSRGGFTRQGGGRQQQSDSPDQQPAFDQALNHAA